MDGMLKLVGAFALASALLTSPAWCQEQLPAPTPAPARREPSRILTLAAAESLAITYNTRIQEARARLDQSRGQATQASLYPNPRYDSGSPQTLAGTSSLYSVGGSQQLVVAGKLQLETAAAERAVGQAGFALLRARLDLLKDVRRQFIALLVARDTVATSRELLANASRSVEASEQLFKAGQIAETDMLLLRIERHRAQASLKAAETTLAGAKQQMAAIIGIANLPIDDAQGTLTLPLPDLEQLIHRQELISQHTQLEIARLEIGRDRTLLQRAEVEPIPNPTVQGAYQYSVTPDHNQPLVGLYFDIPVWNRNQGNILTAAATVRESVAALNSVQNDLLRQLADAIARFQAASRVASNYERFILPDTQRTLELLQKGLQGGQIDLFHVLQGQRAIAQARLELISAQQDRLKAAIDIADLMQADLVHE